MTNKDLAVLNLIPVDKGISREALASAAQMKDREVRRAIARLRAEGEIIINNGSGYQLVADTDLDMIEAYYKRERAAAISLLAKLKKMRLILKEAGRL